MATLETKERAILLSRGGLSTDVIAGVLGIDQADVHRLMLETDPQVSLPPAMTSIWIDWANSFGVNVPTAGVRDICVQEDTLYDAISGEPNPSLFSEDAHSGGAELLKDIYGHDVLLLARGLWLMETSVFMSGSIADNSAPGNNLELKFTGASALRINTGGVHAWRASTPHIFTDQFITVSDEPVGVYLQYFNDTGVNQKLSSVSSILTRILPL